MPCFLNTLICFTIFLDFQEDIFGFSTKVLLSPSFPQIPNFRTPDDRNGTHHTAPDCPQLIVICF